VQILILVGRSCALVIMPTGTLANTSCRSVAERKHPLLVRHTINAVTLPDNSSAPTFLLR
jgi:hypothetical protein